MLSEEFARAGAPMRADFFGDTLVGPTILQWGTEEQKKEFIPEDPLGQIAWCQGFSEPDAGSDLASLSDHRRARRRRVGHQRPEDLDHPGLRRRLRLRALPHRPGRPQAQGHLLPAGARCTSPASRCARITQIDGSAEFAEVFFTDARCPKDNVVGGLNNGWTVAMTTLGFERGTSATTGYRRFETELEPHRRGGQGQRRDRRPADPPAHRPGLVEGADHAHQRPAVARRRRSPARRTSASPPSAPPTRCSGASTTRRS